MNERINECLQPVTRREPRPLPLSSLHRGATGGSLATVRWRVRGRPRTARGGGRAPRARAPGEGRGVAPPEAGGRAAGHRTAGAGGGWLAKRVPGGRKRGGGDAASSVRNAEKAPESAEELRAGVGGLERPPGHGGRGRWLARQRCGPELCVAGTVAALTPTGPTRRYEAEPLPRPTSAAAAGRPRGGWGSAGGRAAPAPAPAPASASREAATGGTDRAHGP